jgi:hypothetical protein
MKEVAAGVNPRRFRVTCKLFWLGVVEEFLKSQVVSKRVPFQRVRKSETEIIKVRGSA